MIYRRILPAPALQAFVREYMLFHVMFDSAQPPYVQPLPPTPEHGLEFLPKGLATSVNQQTGEVKRESLFVLFGQPVSKVNFIMPTDEYLVIRVIFQPGGLHRLLGGASLTVFTDKITDAGDVLNVGMDAVQERLSCAKSYAEQIDIVEAFLLSRVKRVTRDAHPVDRVAQLLERSPTRFSLDWLADQACLSPRQLERKFVERLGIGPKLYSRIVRFHQAFMYKESHPHLDWLSVAVRYGYTDFQHLSKDIKEFAGVSPSILLSEYAHSAVKVVEGG